MIRMLAVFSLAAITLPQLHAQQTSTAPENPCAAPQQKQLDFWVGEWELTWPGEKRGETGHGTNSIKRIMDGCVVQENFSGGDSMHLRVNVRRALRPLEADLGDNEGGYLDFTGDFGTGQMILQREFTQKDGTRVLQRMAWKNIRANEMDWSWEASRDGGKTWQVNWPIHYRRKS